MTRLAGFWSALLHAVKVGLAATVGRLAWEPPRWGRWVGARSADAARHLRAHPSHAAGLALALLAATAGAYSYLTRPRPHYVTYTVEAPGLTEYDQSGVPSYKPLRVSFAESAAPLARIEKAVTVGIALSPAMSGAWTWTTDRELRITWRGGGRLMAPGAGFVGKTVAEFLGDDSRDFLPVAQGEAGRFR